MSRMNVKKSLATLDVSLDTFAGCASLTEEFSALRKAYLKKCLVCHPDKGGDAAVFRAVQASFEGLKELFDTKAVTSFATAAAQRKSTAKKYNGVQEDFERGRNTPSWDFFAEAAQEAVPGYRVELAKSNRSTCKAKPPGRKCPEGSTIGKGEIRIGSMDEDAGSYSRWCRLGCWRVPSKVWLGLPDPTTCSNPADFEAALLSMNDVTLCGFGELSRDDRRSIIEHVMDKANWARLTKRKAPEGSVPKMAPEKPGRAAIVPVVDLTASSAPTSEIVPQGFHAKQERFIVPAQSGKVLAGKTLVLTGVFPELGGGMGLTLGKERAKAMIESFGGKVTSAISGKTDFLVVGKDPGFSKVSQARSRPNVQLMELKDLADGITCGRVEDAVKPVMIDSFSGGYKGNSLALEASSNQMAHARGELHYIDGPAKPASKKRKY